MPSNFKIEKVEKLPDSEALITGAIELPFLASCRGEAIKELQNKAELPGFRKGKIPENILIKELGEMRILEETAEIALAKLYTEIMSEAKLSPIGRPEVSITKLAPGIPLEFKAKIYLEPEVDLPDYKKIASSIQADALDKIVVTDKEVEELVTELKKRGISPELKEGENLEDKIKENLIAEKEMQAKEKRRIKIVESLVKEMKASIPKVLIGVELERMLAQFKDDVSRMGMKWDEYIKRAKKTEENIKEEWREKALERVKSELILAKIAEKEKIEPDEHELQHETEHLLHHYPDADPLRARIYVYTHIRTQKVLEFLENLNKEPVRQLEEKGSKPKPKTKEGKEK